MFLQLHHTTSSLLDEVSHWNETRPTFDADNFRIDMAVQSKEASEVEDSEDVFDDDTVSNVAQVNTPDSLAHHYRYEQVHGTSLLHVKVTSKKVKAIPVTGRGGL
jgi:hypothetical protein